MSERSERSETLQEVERGVGRRLFRDPNEPPFSAEDPPSPPAAPMAEAGPSTGLVAGSVTAGVVGLLVLLAAAVCVVMRRGQNRTTGPEPSHGHIAKPSGDRSDPAMQRLVPAPPSLFATEGVAFVTERPSTMLEPEHRDRISTALFNMAEQSPPQAFAGRYILTNEQFHGGQAVVHIARDAHDTMRQYAIKVFCDARAYEEELVQYRDPVLLKCLPELILASDNSDALVRSAGSGFPFPPFLVIERGLVLTQWVQAERRAMEVLILVESAAELLASLHANGRVHRDIKPDNLLYLTGAAVWRLLDMGICVESGRRERPCCTPVYAPPEVMEAVRADSDIVADASHDVWALGVIAYEAITRTRAIKSMETALACACGSETYPWEADEGALPQRWKASRLRAIVGPCLARDARARPMAKQVCTLVNRLSRTTTQMM